MLVSEFLKQKPSHWDAVRQPREGEEDDDVERFVDADDDDDAFDETRVASKRKNDADADADSDSDSGDRDAGVLETRASETSLEVDETTAFLEKAGDRAKRDASRRYDMSKRDPLYARADASCWWELSLLERNVHPSVAAMARSLLGGFSVEYSGDPLADMTLASFLDKWLQKKPKRLKQSRGGSETMAKRRGEAGPPRRSRPARASSPRSPRPRWTPPRCSSTGTTARARGRGRKEEEEEEGEDLDGDGDDGDGDSASDDDDAVAERRAKKAARAGIEGFDAEEDEADSDAEDVDLGDFEEDASDDEPSGARARRARGERHRPQGCGVRRL